jgi:hypothetical protein
VPMRGHEPGAVLEIVLLDLRVYLHVGARPPILATAATHASIIALSIVGNGVPNDTPAMVR